MNNNDMILVEANTILMNDIMRISESSEPLNEAFENMISMALKAGIDKMEKAGSKVGGFVLGAPLARRTLEKLNSPEYWAKLKAIKNPEKRAKAMAANRDKVLSLKKEIGQKGKTKEKLAGAASKDIEAMKGNIPAWTKALAAGTFVAGAVGLLGKTPYGQRVLAMLKKHGVELKQGSSKMDMAKKYAVPAAAAAGVGLGAYGAYKLAQKKDQGY